MKQGSRLLQVTGILNIIGAGISLIVAIISIAGLGILLGMAAGDVGAGVALVIVAFITTLLGAALQLIAGILGVKNWRSPEKAKSCIIIGAIVVVLALISVISTTVSDGFDFFSFVLGLVLPVLYLIGAFQLKGMEGQTQQPGAYYNPGAVPPPPGAYNPGAVPPPPVATAAPQQPPVDNAPPPPPANS